MAKGPDRFKYKQPQQNNGKPNTEQLIDTDNITKGVKPNKQACGWGKATGRNDTI